MLTLYQDTKIGVAGICYTIPKSFYVVVDDEFCPVKNNGLVFTTREKDCCIEVYTDEYDATFRLYENFTSTVCDESVYTVRGEVDDRKENTLYSIRAEYESKHHSYFEMHMIQCKGYEERIQVLITVEKDKADISEVINREDVKQFINSFKPIKETGKAVN